MKELTKVISNDKVYVLAKEVKKLGIDINKCNCVQLSGFGKALFILEEELEQHDIKSLTLFVDAEEKLLSDLRTNIKAANFVYSFYPEIKHQEEINDKAFEEVSKKWQNKYKIMDKIIKNAEVVEDVNNRLVSVRANIRLKHLITATKDLEVNDKVYVVGNSYFNEIYNTEYLVCKDIDLNVEEDYELENGILYSVDENRFEIFGDDSSIDFNKDVNVLIAELIAREDIKVSQSSVDYVDFMSDDRKIIFGLLDCNFYRMVLGNRYDNWELQYAISLDDVKRLREKEVRIE